MPRRTGRERPTGAGGVSGGTAGRSGAGRRAFFCGMGAGVPSRIIRSAGSTPRERACSNVRTLTALGDMWLIRALQSQPLTLIEIPGDRSLLEECIVDALMIDRRRGGPPYAR